MKVLHLIDSGGLYGAEKMLLSLVQEQVKQGLEPMILSAGERGVSEKAIEAEARSKGLPITLWRMKSGLNLKGSWSILKWAQGNDYNLFHSHGFKFNVLLGMYPENVRRIPMVATLHGYVHAPRFSKMWLYESLDRFAIRRIRGVVLVGEAMKKQLPGKLSSGHTVVIPNGLDISELQESSLASLDEPFKSFFENHDSVILGVGRLSREKGFDRLISAFSEFRNAFPKSGLVIVGEGRLRQQLEALIDELGVKDDVLMPGYCCTVPALLSRSKVLVMPSLTEGLPITLLEAISLKTPVIASAVGEIPKVLGNGEGGELLSDVETATIFSAIEKSVTDREHSGRRVDWAYGAVSKDYSSEAMADEYLAFYKRVLGTP
ncbi:glycosyltransferase [Marinobacter orientalis]|uniref:Glycosyltransferase n=1 Tax=Marinobacter orientalis TaxID=1928859 RepID=A0A7Y0WSC1_9GAMM|nr:glycosyltransferase [Marinobacter orientalis]TGX50090.1 glycosyltransferase [Marinobacter orientalis]